MVEGLSQEELASLTETLKQKFLQLHSDNSEMDQRDIERARNDPLHVTRFVQHNRGNLDNALKHMVDCHKWRKSFGINDLLWTDIDENLWKSGMAYNRGYDKDGNNVCILNIHLHRKDAKKAPMLYKWIAFCFEMHRRVYPQNKLCMVFDMTGAGLSQMDMDLIKFIINSFKIYYPNLLSWLLVYNMPWILQAAWKIVQGWLSEAAVAKVKFVTKDNITEYIPREHLLVKFGGADTWEFDYQTERDRLFELATSVLITNHSNEPVEEELSEEEGEQDQSGRQSRFVEDDEENRPISSEQRLLQGSRASSRGIRRRQVSKLMSLQESKTQHSPFEDTAESASLNGTVRRPSSDVGGVATIGDIMLSPSNELTFVGKKDTEVTCTLTLTNISDNSVIYKIKTTAPNRYKVRPNVAMVDSKSVAKVQVMFSPGPAKTSVSQDKFLVQTYTFSPEASLPDVSQLVEFWKNLSTRDIKEHRMHCRFVSDSPSKSALKEPSTPAVVREPNLQSTSASVLNTDPLKTLELKMTKLCTSSNEMKAKIERLLILNYALIALILLVLLVAYFL